MENKIIIKTPSYRFLMWICTIIFLAGTIGCLLTEVFIGALVFIIFLTLGILGLLTGGRGEITSSGFQVIAPIGRYFIDWEEVEFIETGAGNLVFGNTQKRLCFPSFEFWGGSEKEKAFDFIEQILEEKDLEIVETKRAILPIPLFKNTKII